MKITEGIIALTNRCNLRCQNCMLYQHKDNHFLLPEEYDKLPSTLRHIQIEGGEPFLREELVDIVKVIKNRCPKARITISTNGVLTRIIEEKVKKMPELGLKILVNGPEKLHDQIAGVKGAFRKAMETLKRLKSSGIRELRLDFTLSKLNQKALFEVKKLADQFKVGFSYSINNSPDIPYSGKKEPGFQTNLVIKELEKTRDSCLMRFKPYDFLQAYFTEGLIEYLQGRSRKIICDSGFKSFFLQPNGDIYPCRVLNLKMGNLRQGKIEEIFEHGEHIKEQTRLCPHLCWSFSVFSSSLRKNPFTPLVWCLSHKLKFELLRFLRSPNHNKKDRRHPELEEKNFRRTYVNDKSGGVNYV